MFSNQEAVLDLNAPIRTLDAVRADKVDSRFIAGSSIISSHQGDNYLHVVRFHSELNQLGLDAKLSHPTGAVRCLCTSPNDKSIVLTVAERSSSATLWKIPRDLMDKTGEIGLDGDEYDLAGAMDGGEYDDDDAAIGGGASEMEQVASLTPHVDDDVEPGIKDMVDIVWRGAFDEEPSALGDVLTLDQAGRLAQWDVSLGTTAEMTRTIASFDAERDEKPQWNLPPRMAWDPHNVNITAVSSGTRVKLVDWRLPGTGTATTAESSVDSDEVKTSFQCHRYGITDLDFNPNKPNVLTTAGQDGLLKFWDLRSAKQPLLVARGGHRHWISQVSYNPFHDQLVISAGTDSLVNLWRVSTISSAPLLTLDESNADDKSETSAPNVRVARYEHMDSVYAMTWGAADAWVYATVGYDGKFVLNHVPSKEKYKILL